MDEMVKRELRERARRDFRTTDLSEDEWIAFWKGYLMSLKRFAGQRDYRRSTKSNLGYSRIGRDNV